MAAVRLYLIAGRVDLETIAAAVEGGAGMVQLRLKGVSTADRVASLERCRERLRDRALLIVNDDVGAAFAADGVHVGREDAAQAGGLQAVRKAIGDELLLGTSTRTLAEVTAARDAGCDYVGFGAMARSSSKDDTVLADPAELKRCVEAFPEFPIFPIGGVTPAIIGLCFGGRAAVGSAVMDARDPGAAGRQLLECLDR